MPKYGNGTFGHHAVCATQPPSSSDPKLVPVLIRRKLIYRYTFDTVCSRLQGRKMDRDSTISNLLTDSQRLNDDAIACLILLIARHAFAEACLSGMTHEAPGAKPKFHTQLQPAPEARTPTD